MEDIERVEKLLALQLMHDMQDASQAEKVKVLSKVGFRNPEIADILGTTSAVVAVQLSRHRAEKKKKKAKKKAKSSAKKSK